MIRAGTYTVCIDTNKANEDTYMNWITFRFTRVSRGNYNVERKSNIGGNGQTWLACGTIHGTQLTLLFNPHWLLAACVTVMSRKWDLDNPYELRLGFPNSRIWNVRRRKSAAPSLLRVVVRDKNVNRMRNHVRQMDIATQMTIRRRNEL